eukprot:997096-Amorphochlora_amoeboformis.AAC.1
MGRVRVFGVWYVTVVRACPHVNMYIGLPTRENMHTRLGLPVRVPGKSLPDTDLRRVIILGLGIRVKVTVVIMIKLRVKGLGSRLLALGLGLGSGLVVKLGLGLGLGTFWVRVRFRNSGQKYVLFDPFSSTSTGTRGRQQRPGKSECMYVK